MRGYVFKVLKVIDWKRSRLSINMSVKSAGAPDQTYLAYVLSGGSRSDPVYDKRLHLNPYETSSTNDNPLKHRVLKHTMPAWAPTNITHGRVLAFFEREDCAGLQWKVWVYDLNTHKKYAIARTSMELTSMVWMPRWKKPLYMAYIRVSERQ